MIELNWLLFVLFLILDLIFTTTRASLVHARLPQIISLAEQTPETIDKTIELFEKPQLATTLRLGVTLSHYLLAFSAFMIFTTYWGPFNYPLWMPFLIILAAMLAVLFAEYALEGVVLERAELWALRMTPAARFFDFLFRPFTWLLLLILGPEASGRRTMATVTEDELRNWVQDERNESTLEEGERKMIYSIFQFSDTLVREIMVPRIDVFALDVNSSINEAIQATLLSGHSRLPVYEETIDNLIGLLYAKDLLRVQLNGDGTGSLRELLRSPYFVPEAKKVDELLSEMQERGVHMSIVVDEYGGTAGIVTLEDIVEEIVGEIRDEYDQSEELLYQKIGPNEYLFRGRIDLEDFNDVLGTHLTRDVADTLAGYIYGQIGRIPVGNEKLTVDDWELTVDQVIGRRIRMVRACRISGPGLEEEELHDELE